MQGIQRHMEDSKISNIVCQRESPLCTTQSLSMMKILALHGLGSSTSMLQQQLAPFVRDLGASYQFTFLDGGIPCGRGPGIDFVFHIFAFLLG